MRNLRQLCAALALAGCGGAAIAAGQSAFVHRTYRVGSFDEVTAAGSNLVLVRVGGPWSVSAEGPAETLDKMEVVIDHNRLQIRPRREFRNHFDWRSLKRATFTVTAPRLKAATLAGSGDMNVDRAFGETFAASVAGSGTLDIASVRADRTYLNMAGSGTLTARGQTGRADVSVAGSGNIHARGVASRTAAVSIAGSGTAELTARETAQVSIIGSGSADIAGRAHCTVSRIGSGTAHCNG